MNMAVNLHSLPALITSSAPSPLELSRGCSTVGDNLEVQSVVGCSRHFDMSLVR